MLGLKELIALNANWGRTCSPPAPVIRRPEDYILVVTNRSGHVEYRGPRGTASLIRQDILGWPLILDAINEQIRLGCFLDPECKVEVERRCGGPLDSDCRN